LRYDLVVFIELCYNPELMYSILTSLSKARVDQEWRQEIRVNGVVICSSFATFFMC
jgi:hypothetical protein